MSVSMIPSIVRVRAKGEDEINKYQTILTTKSFVLTHSISTIVVTLVAHSLDCDSYFCPVTSCFVSLNLNTMNTAFFLSISVKP